MVREITPESFYMASDQERTSGCCVTLLGSLSVARNAHIRISFAKLNHVCPSFKNQLVRISVLLRILFILEGFESAMWVGLLSDARFSYSSTVQV